MNVIGHDVTFFDIQSTRAKQYGFCMDLGYGGKLTCCGDEPYDACGEKYARNSEWLLHEGLFQSVSGQLNDMKDCSLRRTTRIWKTL